MSDLECRLENKARVYDDPARPFRHVGDRTIAGMLNETEDYRQRYGRGILAEGSIRARFGMYGQTGEAWLEILAGAYLLSVEQVRMLCHDWEMPGWMVSGRAAMDAEDRRGGR